MRSFFSATAAALLAVCLAPPAAAQESTRLGQPAPTSATSPATLTGKERLGPKWMDEQRIDNSMCRSTSAFQAAAELCRHVPMG